MTGCWPVRIAGPVDPPEVAAGQRIAATGPVSLLGELSRPKLLAQMQRASIFVSPALYEPFGLAVLEAAASGCALVLADIPSFRELWSGAALFVPPRDSGSLAESLRQLCADPARLGRLQRAAARRARRYCGDRMAQACRQAYLAMLSTGRQSVARGVGAGVGTGA
jgi:glycosyltransferase involved in cell wall biosynthesis